MCTAPVKGKARRGRRARDQVRGQRRQQMCCYKGQTPCSPRPGQRSAQKTEEKSQAQWRQNRGDRQGLGDGSGGKQPPERETRQRPPGWTEGATRGAASAQGPALTREPWRRLGPGDTKDPSRRELRRGPDPPPRRPGPREGYVAGVAAQWGHHPPGVSLHPFHQPVVPSAPGRIRR